ncbi:MAG: iron ABC transporter permease [Bacteroidota bacterium]
MSSSARPIEDHGPRTSGARVERDGGAHADGVPAGDGHAGSLPRQPDAEDAFAGADAHSRRVRWVLGGFAGLLVVGSLTATATGAVDISPAQTVAVLLGVLGVSVPDTVLGVDLTVTGQQEAVLLAIRLPRVLLGMVVGAGLAVAGAVLQGLFRNALADPGLIGVSSGASLGAAVAIIVGLATALGPAGIALFAFGGGLATTLIVYRIATRRGRTSVTTMLLAGIAVNALCGAAVGSLVLFADDGQLRDLTFWTLGSLGGASWSTVGVTVIFVGLALAITPWLARSLDAMLLGEAEAAHLGIRTERVKAVCVSLAALAVAAATAAAGLVGFVGLVAPHIVRLSIGPGHRALLPGAALSGAALVVVADLFSRVILDPIEVPIGIVTALSGAPFFLWLLLRERPESFA